MRVPSLIQEVISHPKLDLHDSDLRDINTVTNIPDFLSLSVGLLGMSLPTWPREKPRNQGLSPSFLNPFVCGFATRFDPLSENPVVSEFP